MKADRPSSARHSLLTTSSRIFLLTLLGAFSLYVWPQDYGMLATVLKPFTAAVGQSDLNSVQWGPCGAGDPLKAFLCGSITVPKDYFNESAGNAHIALAKRSATVSASERLGTIWINPGGPGADGVGLALGFGNSLSDVVQGKYDIIGFDPRGIGKTRPLVDCFGSTRAHEIFKKSTVLEDGTSVPPDPFSELGKADLLRQVKELTALQKAEYERCTTVMGDELNYMNTATVVRDLDYMTKALDGPDARVNFLGFSYGTILGAYLVNMLPADRIGRVIIDGVASAPQWANNQTQIWLTKWMVDTDKAFSWFLDDCSRVGPPACRLAKEKGEAAEAIGGRLDELLDKLYDEPQSIPLGDRSGILTAAAARTALYASTNRPASWQATANIFADALTGNYTALYRRVHSPFSDPSEVGEEDMSRAAITCGDQPPGPAPTAQDLLDIMLNNLAHVSRRFAASVSTIEPDGACQFHPALGRTPERFTGPWNNTLDTPMLIVSNTADPITPRASGIELNQLMGNSSVLLTQNSPGHCSLASPSGCTMGHWRSYFVNGTLPKPDTVCEAPNQFFKEPSKLIQQLVIDQHEPGRHLQSLAEDMHAAWSQFQQRARRT